MDRKFNLDTNAKLPWLDGLRGIAALWVLLSHVLILSGADATQWPIISQGALAVDLFMMLSGFLMAHHYIFKQTSEPITHPTTWLLFWIRRIFRIAPLYYLALAAALAAGPTIGDFRNLIGQAWPQTITAPQRYTDNSISNLLMHVSFVFGMLPDYSFRTALPDWSIGLEMQFYLAFPFLMLLMRSHPLWIGCLLIVACTALQWLARPFFAAFPMPAFLPMKLYMFVLGIWVAMSRGRNMRRALVVSILVCGLMIFRERNLEAGGRVLVVLAFYWLMDDGSLSRPEVVKWLLSRFRTILSSRLAVFAGDTSYALYLVHLLILVPISGSLVMQSWYMQLGPTVRFALCTAIVAPSSYVVAKLAHRLIEIPGIQLGKHISHVFYQKRGPGMKRTSNPHPVTNTLVE